MGNQGQLYFGLFLSSKTLLWAIGLLSGFLLLAIVISMMRIYKKAGKPAISVIVPIWGQIVLFQIVELPWWYIFIPIFNFIMMIKAYVLLAKKFGKGAGFAIGMIFFPMIFIPLLSFYDYVDNKPKEINDGLIYNPFNQTSGEQVVTETPVVPTVLTNSAIPEEVVPNVMENQVPVEPVEPINLVEPAVPASNAVLEPTVNEPVMEVTNVVETPIVEQTEIPVESEVVSNIPEIPSLENNMIVNNVLDVVPVVQAETINDLGIEKSIVEPMNQNIEIQENVLDPGVENSTVQDIRNALNINENPMADQVVNTQVETLGNVEKLESPNDVITTQDDGIEMPEIAAKVCPACGVSISGDNNFCTSCGTKL